MVMPHQNRRYILKSAACACCLTISKPAFMATALATEDTSRTTTLPTVLELGSSNMTSIGDSVWVDQIAPTTWLYSVTHPINEFVYPANGLVILASDGAIKIDTGWTSQHSGTLADWIEKSFKIRISLAIATHFHDDRTGGIDALRHQNVRCVSHPLTSTYAKQRGYKVPDPLRDFGTEPFKINDQCELFFTGPGHTADNIVAWLPYERILFGGCFIKSSTSTDLGNLSDASVSEWASSLKNLTSHYPNRRMVIPGHGSLKGDHIGKTYALLETHKQIK